MIAAIAGPLLAPYDPLASDTMAALQAPSARHWFGTDQLGRDVLSRALVATRLDLGIAASSVALVFVLGGFSGLVAGFYGGWVEAVVGRIADTIMAFPLFVLAMGIVAALGNTVPNIVLATAIINFPLYVRVARAETSTRRNLGYVDAARVGGHRDLAVLLRHVAPNILPIMTVQMSLTMGRRAQLHRPRRASAHAGMGDHGGGGRELHRLRRMVGGAIPGRRADAGGVLLQPAGRRHPRHRGPEPADMTLVVDGLSVAFRTRAGIVRALDRVSFSLAAGETLALVGESGSGKSVTAFALLGLLGAAGQVTAGRIVLEGQELAPRDLPGIRGRRAAMIFQNPRAALNPIRPIGRQIADVLRCHAGLTQRQAMNEAVTTLRAVGIPDPERRAGAYPFELSGGMCQRVVIAIAISAKPVLLIADEPTTGLDVTTQATVMDLIQRLSEEYGMATLLITHDLALARERAGRIAVMHAGHMVKTAPTDELLAHPRHPYTRRLLAATPTGAGTLDDLHAIPGTLPDLRRADLPPCRYAARCERRLPECDGALVWAALSPDHEVACWNPA